MEQEDGGGPDLYHVAAVVPDLEAAMARFTALLNYRWLPVTDTSVPILDPATGTRSEVRLRAALSASTPQLELIEEIPGTIWARTGGSNLHHLGFWSDGLAAQSNGLQSSACPLELSGHLPDTTGPAMYA